MTYIFFAFAFAFAGCAPTQPLPAQGVPVSPASSSKSGPPTTTFALFTTDPTDPWIEHLEDSALQAANAHHASLLTFHDRESSELFSDMRIAAQKGAKGAIVLAPDCRDGHEIMAQASSNHLKLLFVDNEMKADPPIPGRKQIIPDFRAAGKMAGQEMLREAKDRVHHDPVWDLTRTGVLIFVSKKFGGSKVIASQIESILVAGGVAKDKIFEIDNENGSIWSARVAADDLIRKHPLVPTWLVGGWNDESMVGGIRAVEDVNIGSTRVIGVGIEGDGAIYDLQRPKPSGVYGSILIPAGEIGTKASEEMFDWIEGKGEPSEFPVSPGKLLNRRNVKELKQSQHLME